MDKLHHPLRHLRPELRHLPPRIDGIPVIWKTNYYTRGATKPFFIALILGIAAAPILLFTVVHHLYLGRSPSKMDVAALAGVAALVGIGLGVPIGFRLRLGKEYYWGIRGTFSHHDRIFHVHLSTMKHVGIKTSPPLWTTKEMNNNEVIAIREHRQFPTALLESWGAVLGLEPLKAAFWSCEVENIYRQRWTHGVAKRFGAYPE